MRKRGYYWVKNSWGEWTIEKWAYGKWVDHGCQEGNDYYVSFFQEIDERRIERTDKAILPNEDYDSLSLTDLQYISNNNCFHCDYTGECQQSFIGGVCRRTGKAY